MTPTFSAIPTGNFTAPVSIGKPTAASTATAAAMDSGKSRLRMPRSIGMGRMRAQTPSTIKRLKIFDPVTLLSAISFAP